MKLNLVSIRSPLAIELATSYFTDQTMSPAEKLAIEAASNNNDRLEELLESEAEPNFRAETGPTTPLLAVREGDLEIVRSSLPLCADVDRKTQREALHSSSPHAGAIPMLPIVY